LEPAPLGVGSRRHALQPFVCTTLPGHPVGSRCVARNAGTSIRSISSTSAGAAPFFTSPMRKVHIMKLSHFLGAAAAMAAFSAGAGAQPTAPQATQYAQAPTGAATTAAVEGEVRKIDKAQGKVTLKHGPIPNLDMSPMTMVFRARNPSVGRGLTRTTVRWCLHRRARSDFEAADRHNSRLRLPAGAGRPHCRRHRSVQTHCHGASLRRPPRWPGPGRRRRRPRCARCRP
jgi:Cu(I)/Ag(I) efflux system protein CusF